MPTVRPARIRTPNFASSLLRGQQIKNMATTNKINQLNLSSAMRKENMEKNIGRLRLGVALLTGVTDKESFDAAKQQYLSMIPAEERMQAESEINQMLGTEYDKGKVAEARKRLSSEYEQWMSMSGKLTIKNPFVVPAGAGVFDPKTGKMIATQPSKGKDEGHDLFEKDGQQKYFKKGGEVPAGWKKVVGKGTTVNIGGKAAPSSERENLNKLFDFKNQLQRISDMYDKGFVGPLEGRTGAFKSLTGLGADEKEVMFRQVVSDIGDTLLRLRSGAQINEQEYKRLQKLVPKLNSPDEVFLADLKSLTTAIDNSIRTRQSTLKQSGYAAPDVSVDILTPDQEARRFLDNL